jgi:hypothetical protein
MEGSEDRDARVQPPLTKPGGDPDAPEVSEGLGPQDAPEDKPSSGGPDDDRARLRDRCASERETMTPRETAECAGTALAEQYEREEDGGS